MNPEIDFSAIIRQVGRGRHGARALAEPAARALFDALLSGGVPDLERGAILLAYRIKGESLEELHGFVQAAQARCIPVARPPDRCPLSLPSYNGARRLANQVPLLALALQSRGIPVLIHGPHEPQPGRVGTAQILAELGIRAAEDSEAAGRSLARGAVTVLALEAVCAPLAALLALRGRLGVRNSAHTVAKMLQPLDGPCIQLLSVTHPDYLEAMRSYYATYPAQVLLMRGTEGEPVVHPRRAQRLEWLHDAQAEVLIDQGETAGATPLPEGLDAPATARWTEDVLAGRAPMPDSIRRQVEAVEKTLARLEPSAAAAERGHARGARP